MADPSLGDLADKFGTDKGSVSGDFAQGHHYAQVYERFLEERRNEHLNVLEIGVWKGASLLMWENYFPNANIIGIENLEGTVQVQLERAQVCTGDATDAKFLDEVLNLFDGGLDVVIDDGSHLLDHQIATIEHLAPRLNPGGLYFVEDVAGSRFSDGHRGFPPFRDFLDYAWSIARQTTFFDNFSSELFHTVRLTDQLSEVPVRSFWTESLFGVSFFYNLVLFNRGNLSAPSIRGMRPAPGEGYRLDQAEGRSPAPVEATIVQAEPFDSLLARTNRLESQNLWLAVEYKKLKAERDALLLRIAPNPHSEADATSHQEGKEA